MDNKEFNEEMPIREFRVEMPFEVWEQYAKRYGSKETGAEMYSLLDFSVEFWARNVTMSFVCEDIAFFTFKKFLHKLGKGECKFFEEIK